MSQSRERANFTPENSEFFGCLPKLITDDPALRKTYIDSPKCVTTWVKGLATVTSQGPFGQKHFVEATAPTDVGGLLKDPEGVWYEVAGGCNVDMVIDAIFGVDLTLYDGFRLQSYLESFGPPAKLEGLIYRGKNYAVSTQGPRWCPEAGLFRPFSGLCGQKGEDSAICTPHGRTESGLQPLNPPARMLL